MAGHSKWANIKHRKAGQDAKRAKIFTKIIRELTVAARNGPNPEDNPRLRAALDKALGANMSRDTIDRAIARGAGNQEGQNLEEITYEGYGPNGVAILVQTMTDNRNRTVAEVRHAFSKRGGNLGTDGSVAYLFTKKGQITFAPGVDEDAVMEVALEVGAEDIVNNDDESLDVFTTPEQFSDICDALKEAQLEYANADIAMIPANYSDLDQESAVKVMGLIDQLEELDDVQNVYSNANFPDDFEPE